ncbi:Uncharacterised protein [Vibrio cholerae]|nr:Uncharacterised protein [Vibrio cholerae]
MANDDRNESAQWWNDHKLLRQRHSACLTHHFIR